MAKVILLDSPSWALFDPKMHLHCGILYLAGSLRSAGHDVKVLDCHDVTGLDRERQALVVHTEKQEPCDILGVSATTANVVWGSQMVRDWPAKVKVLGGPHVTHIMNGPHEKFKHKHFFKEWDYLMRGECELALVEFCRRFDAGEDLKTAPGVVYFNEFGCQKNPEPELPDVTQLANPAFDLWRSGFTANLAGSQLPAGAVYPVRGCPYGCHFCADARTKLREETLEQTESQVQQLHEMGVRAIHARDDTFTIRDARCRKVADLFDKYNMKWRACTRVNLRDQDLFNYFAARGCNELGFGVEHGSDRMLKLMNKGTTAAANEAGIKMCQAAGIIARAFLMIGFPGETEESIAELEEWVLRVRPSAVSFNLFQPFPGSDVWNHPERYGVRLPNLDFTKFWQVGGDDDPEMPVLELSSISRERLFYHKQRLMKLFTEEIGSIDRRQVHGNIGTYSSPVVQEMLGGSAGGVM
jgi:anaerobic magnesium-protoporphyrin IX monomethyl ester cyclase